MPNPDKAEPEVLDDEEALEDVVDLLGAGLRDLDTRAAQTREAVSAVPDTALEELATALHAAPLFNGVSPEGVQVLASKARRINIQPFQTLIDSETPSEGLLGEHGLLIAQERLIVDVAWLENLETGHHLGEGGWLGDPRMVSVNSQDEGAALIIDQALSELGLSPEDQLQIGFNALAHSPLAGDNTRLAESIPDDLLRIEGDTSFEDMAREAAERLGLTVFETEHGEALEPPAGHVFLGLEGTVNIHAPDSSSLLGQIQFPNLCFEVNGAAGKATATIVAHGKVRGYWLPLAAEGKLRTEDRLVLLQEVRRSHRAKVAIANQQVRDSIRSEGSSPKEVGTLAGILSFFKRLRI